MTRILAFVLWLAASFSASAGVAYVPTSDPAASQQTQDELTYLKFIGHRGTHRIIMGQMCCRWTNSAAWYATDITSLQTQYGPLVGLVGGEFNEAWNAKIPDYTELISTMTSAWRAGQVVALGYHAANPWTGGSYADLSCGTPAGTLADLVDPTKPVYAAWHTQIGKIAQALQQLQTAGVTVLFRPMMEMNGSNWWYLSCRSSDGQFAAVWRDMFQVFTSQYNLHNLLWVFAGTRMHYNFGCDGSQGESMMCLYPGDDVVDVIGDDEYSDVTGPMPEAFEDRWTEIAAHGKVVAFAERGGDPAGADGASQIYTTLLADLVANRGSSIPAVSYLMAWDNPNSGLYTTLPGVGAALTSPLTANAPDILRARNCMAGVTSYAEKVACVLKDSLIDVINQNTVGGSQGTPLDVPSDWSWFNGYEVTAKAPPSNFTSVTGWGQVYEANGAPANAGQNASVSVMNFNTFVLLNNGQWVEVQQQGSSNPLVGTVFSANYANNASTQLASATGSDGSVTFAAPTAGQADNFWTTNRGNYTAGSVVGIFVEASAKTSDPGSDLIANLGADWWASNSAGFVADGSNNPGAGESNWVKLTSSYQNLYFTTLSAAELRANPPPGLPAN